MDLKQLRAFLTVAETGNMTRAADILHLVQPAISRQIRMLEEDLGVTLFTRQRHGMVMTESGQALVSYARRAMLELDRARAEIGGNAEAGITGLVTLGLLPSTVDILSSELITRMTTLYSGIRVRIVIGYAGTLVRWLESGEIDAALLYGEEQSTNIQTVELVEEPLWVVGPSNNKLRKNKPLELSELSRHKVILPSAPHGIRTIVEHACAVAHVSLNICAETNALSVQRALVLGGHGLTILPPIAVADDLKAKRLSGSPLCNPSISRTIVLGLPTNRSTARYTQHTVEILIQTMHHAIKSGAWLEARWLDEK